MTDSRDYTAETFGLLIAYVLPGLSGLFALSLWVHWIELAFLTFLSVNSNLNLFLLLVLASVCLSMVLTAIRGFLFEAQVMRKSKLMRFLQPLEPSLTREEIAGLTDPQRFAAYLMMNDLFYRYHQCWGGMSLTLPIFYAGWLKRTWLQTSMIRFTLGTLLYILVQTIILWAAKNSYERYLVRSRSILERPRIIQT